MATTAMAIVLLEMLLEIATASIFCAVVIGVIDTIVVAVAVVVISVVVVAVVAKGAAVDVTKSPSASLAEECRQVSRFH